MKNLAAAYHMTGQYEEAANMLQQALELDPTASTWANLGTMRYFQGNFADSARAMEKATELASGNYLYWGNLGDAYRWTPGDREKALPAYRKAISLVRAKPAGDDDPIDRSRLATYLAKIDETAQAISECARLERTAGTNADVMFNLAIAYEISHDRTKALDALGAALGHGYSIYEIEREPELAQLRSEPVYRRLLSQYAAKNVHPQ